MNMPKLYHNEDNDNFYLLDSPTCHICNNEEYDAVYIVQQASKSYNTFMFFCPRCYDQAILGNAPLTRIIPAVVSSFVPPGSIPVLDWNVTLTSRGLSCVDVAIKNLDNEKVIDKTVYAGREKAQPGREYIGNPDLIKELEKKDATRLEFKDALQILKDSQNARPVIDQDQKRFLK